PLDPDSEEDKATALRFLEFQASWWADPIYFGDYPASMKERIGSRLPTFTQEESTLLAGSNDFFGLNHYTSWYITDIPDSVPPRAGTSPAKALAANITLPVTPPGDGWAQDVGGIQTKVDLNGVTNGVVGETDWLTVVPDSFRLVLVWVSSRYGRPIIMVTENGMDRAGEADMRVEDAVKDYARQTFYKGYIESMVTAIVEDAVDVRGYYAWSILDNFEWSDGYVPRFGLTYVDYDSDQERIPKQTSDWFSKLAEARKERRNHRRRHHADANDSGGYDSSNDSRDSSSSSSSSSSSRDDSGYSGGGGGPAAVEMAAGRGQGTDVGGSQRHGVEVGKGALAGLVVLCVVLAAAVGGMGFGLGKYGGQRYEGMDGLSRMSNERVFVYVCLSFVLGGACSGLMFAF
ncbi:unnamed protein product, partial [Pylaiella littoralis]